MPERFPSGGIPKFQPSRAKQGVVGAVDDALGADVHQPAGRHLPVIGDAQRAGPVELRLIVKLADHQPVGDDDARRQAMRAEKPQGMALT